jgi:hypothetical protein
MSDLPYRLGTPRSSLLALVIKLDHYGCSCFYSHFVVLVAKASWRTLGPRDDKSRAYLLFLTDPYRPAFEAWERETLLR